MALLPLRPNSELVVCEWIRTIPDLVNGGVGVATELPLDNSTWGVSGFVIVNVLGGNPDAYIKVGRPVVQIEAFAVKPNTGKPIWGTASAILSAIQEAAEDEAHIRRTLEIKAGPQLYGYARMLEAYPIEEQMRLYKPASDMRLTFGDEKGQYARKAQMFQFHWVTESVVVTTMSDYPADLRTYPYVHTQSTPATVWTITHTLPYSPDVTVVIDGRNVVADITYPNATTVTITFPTAEEGTAMLQ